jgi:hypothetical protein
VNALVGKIHREQIHYASRDSSEHIVESGGKVHHLVVKPPKCFKPKFERFELREVVLQRRDRLIVDIIRAREREPLCEPERPRCTPDQDSLATV